nr:uncharacterized protein LOC111424673 [Onthophagus taurus]XP_022914070.1 uncharacterized protein LOC111424673 [Onthophagus taurus]XP_022914071.1 uncharacterized protein LOC111424673 [Onthophagus taurus]
MSDCRTLSRDFLREFLEMYRELPCLWHVKPKAYLDKNKKNDAYKMLVKKLQVVQPNATKAFVITKINSLRGGFRREHKKVLKFMYLHRGTMTFFCFFETRTNLESRLRTSLSSDDEDNNVVADESNEPEEEGDSVAENERQTNDESHLDVDLLSPPSTSTSDSTRPSSVLPNKAMHHSSAKRRFKKRNSTSVVDKADQILNVVSAKLNDPGDDEFSIVGKNVAANLRKLPAKTKFYMDWIYNDLLFQAELGKISENTKIITEIIQPTGCSNTCNHHDLNQLATNNLTYQNSQ